MKLKKAGGDRLRRIASPCEEPIAASRNAPTFLLPEGKEVLGILIVGELGAVELGRDDTAYVGNAP